MTSGFAELCSRVKPRRGSIDPVASQMTKVLAVDVPGPGRWQYDGCAESGTITAPAFLWTAEPPTAGPLYVWVQ